VSDYGRADERFTWGQLIVFNEARYKELNWTSKRWRGPGRGRVYGFSRKFPWCVIVLVDGWLYPVSYAHSFWDPA
jgi:hypothetical protein